MNLVARIALTASLISLTATLTRAAQQPGSFETAIGELPLQTIDEGGIEIDQPNSVTPATEATAADKAKAAGQLPTDDSSGQFAPGLPGDISGDQIVNTDDLLLIIDNWGPCLGETRSPSFADIEPPGGDCMVDFNDMMVVLMNWGA
jgi:hypothetical protein